MRCHIICHVDSNDAYQPVIASVDRRLHVFVGQSSPANRIRNNVQKVLTDSALSPHAVTVDLVNAAISVFAADMRVPRECFADGWTRSFVLHLPVANEKRWRSSADVAARMLSYLTGDRWTIETRLRSTASGVARKGGRPLVDAVSLFSGGLDSFVGAVDLVEAASRVALVAHYAEGISSTAQDAALGGLMASGRCRTKPRFHKFYVSPPTELTNLHEDTMRSRSLLFLSLGMLVADAYGRHIPLVVAENGFISLNVPLAPSRDGSLSTRTTHPHFIRLFGELAKAIGLQNEIRMPYKFATKGEMLAKCQNASLLGSTFRTTMSCAHPAAARWTGGDVKKHCGYCIPCLVRRAALSAVSLDDATDYNIDVTSTKLSPKTKRGEDIQAVSMAVLRYAGMSRSRLLLEALKSGPIETDAAAFADVFGRGIEELNRFLHVRP